MIKTAEATVDTGHMQLVQADVAAWEAYAEAVRLQLPARTRKMRFLKAMTALERLRTREGYHDGSVVVTNAAD